MTTVRDDVFAALRTAAEQALPNAYAPYSRFHVAAALSDASGRVFVGVNVENASYGLTICAERNAIAAAVAAGVRSWSALVVVCSGDALPMPCGACRQVICELAPACFVRCYDRNGSAHTSTADSLLPERFRFTP